MNCRYALSSRSVVVSRSRLPSISEAFQRPRIVKGHASSATLEADGFGCLLLEIDGAVTDLHMDGHRVAFNKSLARMGYECAQFTPPIYNDLLQGGDGTAEGLVTSYFMRMGWPMMLATSDQPLFIKKARPSGTVVLYRIVLSFSSCLQQRLNMNEATPTDAQILPT